MHSFALSFLQRITSHPASRLEIFLLKGHHRGYGCLTSSRDEVILFQETEMENLSSEIFLNN